MATTVFDVLIKKVEEQQASAQTFITRGTAKEYAEYREAVGLLRGLDHAKQLIQDLANSYGEEE